jgi:hypothetical protein
MPLRIQRLAQHLLEGPDPAVATSPTPGPTATVAAAAATAAAALSDAELRHFEAFGFITKRQLFSPPQVRTLQAEAERLYAVAAARATAGGGGGGAAAAVGFEPTVGETLEKAVEQSELLTNLLLRGPHLVPAIGALCGGATAGGSYTPLWCGSEINTEGGSGTAGVQKWHADRPGAGECSFTRIKVLLYLTPTDADALQILPGSHLPALHTELEPLHAACDGVLRARGVATTAAAAGNQCPSLASGAIPSYACAAEPGDAVIFHQSCLHAVFEKAAGRRYIALKFSARPRSDDEWASLWRHNSNMFRRLHPTLAAHRDARVRGLVDILDAEGARRAERLAAELPFPHKGLCGYPCADPGEGFVY